MWQFFKKPKLPTTIFVIASLSSFLILMAVFLMVTASNTYLVWGNPVAPADRLYLKSNIDPGDPMVTKAMDLKQVLAGPILSSRDPSLGSESSPVTVVLFSDFSCEFCQQQEIAIRKAYDLYENKIRVVWKDYPELKLESDSFQAALAARCANEQGKFWPYHDLLFKNRNKLSDKTFYSIANQLKLDNGQFDSCFQGLKTKQYIDDNILEANALEISGVPFIYVNDQEMIGAVSFEDLDRMIKRELSKQSKK